MNSSFTQTFQKSPTLHRFSILHVCIEKETREKKLAKNKARERGTLLRWSLPLIIQFAVMVSQTRDILAASYSWQANQMQSKAIMLLLKPAFTVVQGLLQKCSWNVLLSASPAAEVAFHLHIKANRKNTSSATTQVQKYIENICACAFSWGIWDALELWTGISKLTCRTNVCHFSSMLKIHSSPSCSWYNSTSPTPATHCPDAAHTHAAPLQHNSGNLQQRWSHCDYGVCVLATWLICNALVNSIKDCAASLAGRMGTLV